MSSITRKLYSRLATTDPYLLDQHINGKTSKDPHTAFNTCSITFPIWMQSSFYIINNAFTQIDAYRSFRFAAQQSSKSSAFDETSGTYVVNKNNELLPHEIESIRLSYDSFNNAIRQAASIYHAATDGLELLDPGAVAMASQEEADEFAATFTASLPEPVMFLIELTAEEKEAEEAEALAKKTASSRRISSSSKKQDKTNKAVRPKEKENIEATLHQYINRMQLRLLSSYVLSTLIYYQHGIRQLYISYMTDDILTGEPPSWSTICTSQLQLKPSDVDTCMCALRVTPDLVPHREFQSILMTLSPVSGCLLFSQFIELLWRCAIISPIASDDTLQLDDSEILQSLFVHAGMRADLPVHNGRSGAARRRENAMANNTNSGQKISSMPLHSSTSFAPSPIREEREEFSYNNGTQDTNAFHTSNEQEEQELRIEVNLRNLLDQLESNLTNQESNMLNVPSFGFPSKLTKRSLESNGQFVWHPMPCVVREVCRAPDGPLIVENLLESALSYHNSSQYDLAINAYISARMKWLEYLTLHSKEGKENKNADEEDDEDEETKKVPIDISPRASIFILCGIGSVHESAGNDEMALTCYLDAQRTALSRLSHDDPDMAVAYSHLGSVCFHLGRFTTASRCYRVAVSIRHHLLGSSHPDCAASHSSLGASLCMLGPSSMVEARYHLKLAAKELKRQLGPTHPRTVVASRNSLRARGRPTNMVTKQDLDENGKRPSRFVSGMKPKTISLRDDGGFFHPGGKLPGVTGKASKKKKGKGKGKKKKKK